MRTGAEARKRERTKYGRSGDERHNQSERTYENGGPLFVRARARSLNQSTWCVATLALPLTLRWYAVGAGGRGQPMR